LGDWNSCNACFNAQLSRFLDQANKFMNAVMVNTEPGPIIALKAKRERPTAFDAFPERAATFTEAQHRVFELLITGRPNKLIAFEIGVAEATVKAHVSAVLRKLQVRSRAQAIALSSAFERNRTLGSERRCSARWRGDGAPSAKEVHQ
jgi:DNA-binding NarL/FixJ family response regulator